MFTLKAGEKKFLAIATIVGLLFVVVVGVSVALLTVGKSHDEDPYVQASNGKNFVRVQPTALCKIDLSDLPNCPSGAKGTFARNLPVAVGETIWVSVSKDIAQAPWSVALEYLTPRGFEVVNPDPYAPGSRYALELKSTKDRILSTIEIRLPSSRVDAEGSQITRGYWSINTLPETSAPTPGAPTQTFDGPVTKVPVPVSPPTLFSSDVPIQPPAS